MTDWSDGIGGGSVSPSGLSSETPPMFDLTATFEAESVDWKTRSSSLRYLSVSQSTGSKSNLCSSELATPFHDLLSSEGLG